MNKLCLLCVCLMFLAGCEEPPPKRSELPSVFRAEYLDNSCGPAGAHIKLIEATLPAATGEDIQYGFEFYTPEGVRTPDDPEWSHAVAGNVYELEAYYYYRIEYGRRILEPRLDLIGWRLIAPYKMVDDSSADSNFTEYWDLPKQDNTVFQLSRPYNTDCPEEK
ncbi:hypothetical protein QSV34_13780 [Porticoccus sp. W117]|uniref:hypothetical protein n=1 Tax=Porticoccus sp. W117 TaxID=3054777 RepID=UPI0025988DB3|nr:hypothetical protein [Porticoccus sp. W117]MDM3872417.1 hypothetical protein [Porticoccus sp. W117]